MSLLAKQLFAQSGHLTPFDMSGNTYYVKKMSGNAFKEFQAHSTEDMMSAAAYSMIACLCDEEGRNIFKVTDFEDVMALDTAVIMALSEKVMQHCGVQSERETSKN
jgi:hypothetical protein